jgi:IPTL-CTERM motif
MIAAPLMRAMRIGLVFFCLMLAGNASATHGNGGVAVDYVGSLNPSAAVAATLTNGYDWYCFAGTAGTAASVTVTRTSGTLLPNLELWAGVVANGTPSPYAGLVNNIGTNTSNSSAASVTSNYTLPASASGKYSVVVSTWTGEVGSYSIALTGGTATSCAVAAVEVVPTPVVPTLSSWALLILASLIGFAALCIRRR